MTPIRFLRPISFLSFGPDNGGLALRPLNVLVGPNGSGKSNFIEALNFLRSSPRDWRDVVRRGGGAPEWLWKGNPAGVAGVEAVIDNNRGSQPLRHAVSFRIASQAFLLEGERVENEKPNAGMDTPYFFYKYHRGEAIIKRSDSESSLTRESITPDLSILAQRRDPEIYPALAAVASTYEGIRIYREWAFGRSAIFREPQKADQRNDRLEEDFSNLGLFLNRIRTRFPAAKRELLARLRELYDGLQDFDILVEGGTVQLFLAEADYSIPATRLSDGTLRYLCLLAILCDPEPPAVVCLEEPELGLHPDLLPKLADLMIAASLRMQLIVTTHSDILVDAMTETPESVVVCEKHRGGTTMRRLDSQELVHWLDQYRLGQLWVRGEIGGTRW